MKKGAIEIEELGKIILAVVLLAILIGLVWLFKEKGISGLARIKEFFRFGR